MVHFKRHTITYGDTMQSIAQQELGDMNLWVELIQFNNLKYPYIVDTVQEKLRDPEHLVTIGDTILVRISNDEQANLIAQLKNMNEFDYEEIYATALGKDLDILPVPKEFGAPGWDSEILEMKGNEKGSIATVRGVENLKQSLLVRIITPLGSYVGHPKYGSRVHEYLGNKNTEENAILLNIEIERTIRTDGRVTKVELQDYKISGDTYSVSFKVWAVGLDVAFEFILTSQADGPIVLTNDLNYFNE